VVNSVERMRLWTRASAATLVLFPIGLVLVWSGMGSLGLVIAIMIEEMVSNFIVVSGLRRVGFPYRVDYAAMVKMAFAAALAFECARLVISAGDHAGKSVIVAGAAFATGIFLLACYFLKPFHRHERESINRLVKRNIFVW